VGGLVLWALCPFVLQVAASMHLLQEAVCSASVGPQARAIFKGKFCCPFATLLTYFLLATLYLLLFSCSFPVFGCVLPCYFFCLHFEDTTFPLSLLSVPSSRTCATIPGRQARAPCSGACLPRSNTWCPGLGVNLV